MAGLTDAISRTDLCYRRVTAEALFSAVVRSQRGFREFACRLENDIGAVHLSALYHLLGPTPLVRGRGRFGHRLSNRAREKKSYRYSTPL